MTVCVAVLCQDGSSVVGASDQMLSTQDNRFQRPKIYHMTTSVVMLIAGDWALHSELLVELRGVIRAGEQADPSTLTIKNIAHAYSMIYAQAKIRHAERDFLLPLGLDAKSFLSLQQTLSPTLVSNLTSELVNYRLPSCSAIFAGVDTSEGFWRAHIYTAESGVVTCHDDVGFAAIGSGANHANSHLMATGHSAGNTTERALYLAYAAKRRAEVAPSVGVETELFFAPANDNRYVILNTHVVENLARIYGEAEDEHKRINDDAERKCHAFVQTLSRPTPIEQQSAAASDNGSHPTPEDQRRDIQGAGDSAESTGA